jgi:hypothetical protein
MLKKLGGAFIAALAAILLASCSAAPAANNTTPGLARVSSSRVSTTGAPVPGRTLRKLPDGVFYFLAGATPGSCNLWEVRDSGAVRELTHNGELGISYFGAERPGIVVADAASGADELAQVTAHGIRYLRMSSGEGHGETPIVDDDGNLAYTAPPLRNQYFKVLFRRSFNGRARIVYRSRLPLSPTWGPGGQVAVVSQRYATATTKARSWLKVISTSNGKVSALRTNLRQFDYAIWGAHVPGIVISPYAGGAEFIGQGRHLMLPPHWAPLSWSPGGRELLVMRPPSAGKPEDLGLWTEKNPRAVALIGPADAGTVITQAAWLNRAASLK